MPRDPAVDRRSADVAADVAHHVARREQATDIALAVDVDFNAVGTEVGFVLPEFHGMFAGIDAFLVHIVEQRGEPFAPHGPAHVFKVFRARAGTVHIGGARAVELQIGKGGRPDVAGHVAGFHVGLGDERADGLAVGIPVDADPCGLAAAGEETGPGMAVGLFHIDEMGPQAPRLCDGVTGSGRAHVRVEHLARRGIGREQAADVSRSDHYGFGLHDAIGRLVGGNIKGQSAGDAVIVTEQFQHRRVVDDTDASFLGLFREHLFLIVAVILEENFRTPRIGMAFEVEIPGGLHVDAPVIPHVDDRGAGFQKTHDKRRVVAGGVLAVHKFFIHHIDGAVLLRDIAEKMIVTRGSRPAALRVGLIQQGYARAFVRRRNSGHKSGDAAADDENVRFQPFFNGDHDDCLRVIKGC